MFQFVASFLELKDFVSLTLLKHLGWLLWIKCHFMCLYDVIICQYRFTPLLLYDPFFVSVSQGL